MAMPPPDSTIKLFGRTIALSDSTGAATEVSTKLADEVRRNSGTPCIPNVKSSSFCSKASSLNGIQTISSQGAQMETDLKPEEVKSESDGSGQEKEVKKPDKILPCPRCNSMVTKFCYFNNYNVNQPRHYCKDCKRYWTEGGTMRNVPIGSGRRKKKDAYQHHDMMSCDETVSNGDASDATHQQSLPVELRVLQRPVKRNERVTKSGSEVWLRKKAQVPNTREQNNSLGSVDNKEEKSCATSSTVSGCSENWVPENTVTKEQNDGLGNSNGVKDTHPHNQSYPGPALVVPRSPGWNRVADMASTQCSTESVHGLGNGTASKVSLPPPQIIPAPGLSAPAVPFPLGPPLWSCIAGWPNGMWSSQKPGSNGSTLPSPLKLGKHSREETLQGEENNGNKIWVPKALRITDPEEAAKSSILASLGIKPDEKGVFEPFQSKVLEDGKTAEAPQAQQANPAAVSRSQSFQERA